MTSYDLFNSIMINQFGGSKKWTTLFHYGPQFPPEYEPHNIPLKYEQEYVKLPALAEEYAMLYAKYINTDYVKNKTFNKNFFNDWKKVLPKDSIIQSFEKCDFTEYHAKLTEMKQCKKNPEKTTDETTNKYSIAIVDGKEQIVGNYRMEPPGLFIGRGENPNIGKIKKRILPNDITINISSDAPEPELPNLNSEPWKKIIHDRNVEWLASWTDNITHKIKYIWLNNSSDFKANNDLKKFELARKLKKKIKKIITENTKNLLSNNIKTKQLATALYLIDKLAIRVGNEKTSDESDTVGVTTLRIEHISLINNILELDFLGKDSVRYTNSITIDDTLKNNITSFMHNKDKYDQLFDKINSNDINAYLQSFMKDLTAKLFRTYNASHLFQKELNKITKKYCSQEPSTDTLISEYNMANIKVAKLLNHQKNINKSHKIQIDKIAKTIKKIRKKISNEKLKNKPNSTKITKYREHISKLKNKKNMKEELKNLSLGTSKDNYIDPRITIAFMKTHNLLVDKIFTEKLQKKFKWAFDVDENFVF